MLQFLFFLTLLLLALLVRYFGATTEPLLWAKDRSSMQLKIPNQAPFSPTLVHRPQKASPILPESP
jgi:hypothetical protein